MAAFFIWRRRHVFHHRRPSNLGFLVILAGVGAKRLLGDVIVAFQTTQREAVELHLPLEHHFAHLIIHGVLHLLGYDHMEEGDAAIMEKLEVEALARLGIGNPYEEDALDG